MLAELVKQREPMINGGIGGKTDSVVVTKKNRSCALKVLDSFYACIFNISV